MKRKGQKPKHNHYNTEGKVGHKKGCGKAWLERAPSKHSLLTQVEYIVVLNHTYYRDHYNFIKLRLCSSYAFFFFSFY